MSSMIKLRAGLRGSRLSRIQARSALAEVEKIVPDIEFSMTFIDNPGDVDRRTDLRTSPEDFFTRGLDDALLHGQIDCAVHSAKDLPETIHHELDWRWLPWSEDRRDVLVLRPGEDAASLKRRPVAGISSKRREDYVRQRFPDAILRPIRGNIEERLAQLDAGAFDLIVTAGAALKRLGLEERITEWIPLEELDTPEAQGTLALTFRRSDPRLTRLCSLFTPAVTFAGAGVGSRDLCTLAALHALKRCDICLYDSLMDRGLLEYLPPVARPVDVGKRAGHHRKTQPEINALLEHHAKCGRRVVRLKGGDPGIFGRLAEEVATLEAAGIPYRVIPGISSLAAAATGTGMLLTRRGVSPGFCVMTPRKQGGGMAAVGCKARAQLPIVLFMATRVAADIAQQLIADSVPGETPAAMVFNAGSEQQSVVRANLDAFAGKPGPESCELHTELQRNAGEPGLFIIGDPARYSFDTSLGALQGTRVLITCSDAVQQKTADAVRDFGGKPVQRPLIQLKPRPEASAALDALSEYDWLALTSPSAVRCFRDLLGAHGLDVRSIPAAVVCGEGTAAELERLLHIQAQVIPGSDYSGDSLVKVAGQHVKPGDRVLRLRSEKAGARLADALRGLGCEVEDVILYDNQPVEYESLPSFDAIFFASRSAVDVFAAQRGTELLDGKILLAIGGPTADGMAAHGLAPTVRSPVATVHGAITALAGYLIRKEMERMNGEPTR